MKSIDDLKLLVLTRYSDLGASSRLRFFQYYPHLRNLGIKVEHDCLISNSLLKRKYRVGSYGFFPLLRAYIGHIKIILKCRSFDVVWVEKELLPWFPYWIEKLLLSNTVYILDYDDAVFHNYDKHSSKLVRFIYGKKIDRLMAGASLVVCGNEYLASRARTAGSASVQIIPTVINLNRYSIDRAKIDALSSEIFSARIVWVGTPSTEKYLQLLVEPLQKLSETHNFLLRVIGAPNFEISGVSVELVEWSEEAEFENIASCDIGVMPLLNSPWERGKCGYKLIQYMASGLPVVASNVGVNSQIVMDGINGYLVDTPLEWSKYLGMLLDSRATRIEMGLAGRKSVESEYNIQKQGPIFANLLKEIVNKRRSGVNN